MSGYGVDTSNMKKPRDYNAALKVWSETKPWRGYTNEHDERPLDANRSKKNFSIRKKSDGAIACRLYRTDVVTFCPDGSIDIQPYPSSATNRFAGHLLPSGVAAGFTDKAHVLWFGHGNRWDAESGMRGYQLSSARPTKIVQQWADSGDWSISPTTPPVPFEKYLIGPGARAALKAAGYEDFRAWLRAARGLGGEGNDEEPSVVQRRIDEDRLAFLATRERWTEVLALHPNEDDGMLQAMRKAIYTRGGHVLMVEVPYVTTWKDVIAIHNSRKLQWLR